MTSKVTIEAVEDLVLTTCDSSGNEVAKQLKSGDTEVVYVHDTQAVTIETGQVDAEDATDQGDNDEGDDPVDSAHAEGE